MVLNRHSKKIFNILQKGILLFLTGCSGLEQSEEEKLKEANAKGEYIYRRHDEVVYSIGKPQKADLEPYPWEKPADSSCN